MPHISREKSNSKIQHVIVQGINREYIFGNSKHINKYKDLIYKKLHNSNLVILAYCIMSNHAHLLIYREKMEELSKFMQKLNTAYAMYYNKVQDRVGFVFRGRYYAQEILNQGQLYTCLRYIHNNPVKAKICKKMGEYPYSSYNEFFDSNSKLITDKSLKILFDKTINFEDIFHSIHKKQSIYNMEEKENINEFMEKVEKFYNISIKDIKNNSKKLGVVIEEARKQTNATVEEIIKILDISKTTFYKYLKS